MHKNMYKIQWLILLLAVSSVKGHAFGFNSACTNQDGSLGITFGNHGKVVTDVGGIGSQANGVVVLPCGDIVAAGSADILPTSVAGNANILFSSKDFALVRYTPYGSVDTRFGMNGIVLTDFAAALIDAGRADLVFNNPSSDVANALAVQKNCDGCDETCKNHCDDSCNNNCKLVVVGSSDVLGRDSFAVARYNCDGTLDTSFGIDNSGVMVIPFGSSQGTAFAVAIQPDGKIVVAGSITYADGSSDFAVVRLNCDGTLDHTFGCDRSGIVTIDFGGFDEEANAVKIQQDGKIVVAGTSDARGLFDFALARLTPDGRLDVTFGDKNSDGLGRTGKVLTDFSGNETSDDVANALVLVEECTTCCKESDLAIVAVGISAVDGTSTFALAGYTIYGSLDRNFGDNGLVTTQFEGATDSAALAATSEHECGKPCKIVAVGDTTVDGNTDFALARYLLDGTLDIDFGIDGMITTDFFNALDSAQAVAVQENGDIIAAGVAVEPPVEFALARYNVCDPCCTPCGVVCAPCQPCR